MFESNKRFASHFRITITTILLSFGMSLSMGAVSYAHPGNVSSDGAHYCRTNCEGYGYQYGERICHYPSDGCGGEGLTQDSYEGGDSSAADDTPDYSAEDATPSYDDTPSVDESSVTTTTPSPDVSVQDTNIPSQDTASKSSNVLVGAAVGATAIGGLALAQYFRKT